jgi:hypothetical protein
MAKEFTPKNPEDSPVILKESPGRNQREILSE